MPSHQEEPPVGTPLAVDPYGNTCRTYQEESTTWEEGFWELPEPQNGTPGEPGEEDISPLIPSSTKNRTCQRRHYLFSGVGRGLDPVIEDKKGEDQNQEEALYFDNPK